MVMEHATDVINVLGHNVNVLEYLGESVIAVFAFIIFGVFLNYLNIKDKRNADNLKSISESFNVELSKISKEIANLSHKHDEAIREILDSHESDKERTRKDFLEELRQERKAREQLQQLAFSNYRKQNNNRRV